MKVLCYMAAALGLAQFVHYAATGNTRFGIAGAWLCITMLVLNQHQKE